MKDRYSRLALALVCVAILGSIGFWWETSSRPDIVFLPRLDPAQWIICPTGPDFGLLPVIRLPAQFRTSFNLEKLPANAPLKIAGLHEFALSINGISVTNRLPSGGNWKQPDLFDVSSQLRRGENRLEVTVWNTNGPPALWLYLNAGSSRITSGAHWQGSLAGAAWRNAVLVTEPRQLAPDGPISPIEQPGPSALRLWKTLLVFAAISAGGYWILATLLDGGDTQLPGKKAWCKTHFPIVIIIGMWVALFANNLGPLPADKVGFDVQFHLDYIRYIQEHGALPLAGDGWEMFQPPLYYALAAALLELFTLTVSDPAGLTLLRILGLGIGIGNCVIVWASLRLLFTRGSEVRWGILFAGFLPAIIYLSQYFTNEVFAATLVSGCVLLTLYLLKQESASWKQCVALGLCLGAALLSKPTALLAVPSIGAALAWRWLENRKFSVPQIAGRIAVIVAVCTVTSGWHYARAWLHYGSPLIGNWDTATGYHWWQNDGYRTSAFFLRFGDVLVHPWFSAFRSFGDGMYSTLWGDGLIGGVRDIPRPPWNFDFMAVGYWLSLLPSLAILGGAVLALVRFVRRPSAEWLLMLALSGLSSLAVVYMSLVVPSYAQSKAFYGLFALIPLCAFGASGFSFVARRSDVLGFVLAVLLGVWAINSYVSFWVLRSSVASTLIVETGLIKSGQYTEAADLLSSRLKSKPTKELRLHYIVNLMLLGRLDAAGQQIEILGGQEPANGEVWLLRAMLDVKRDHVDEAIKAAKEGLVLSPGNLGICEKLTVWLTHGKRYDEAIDIARQGLQLSPFYAELRVKLGYALLLAGRDNEGLMQLQYAFAIDPRVPRMLNDMAWNLATTPEAGERNGRVAVKLAREACQETEYKNPICIATLAAGCAEAGDYDDAVKDAEQARDLAVSMNDAATTQSAQTLIDTFKAHQPYRAGK